MENSCIQLNDLPDEILMIIFKKLTNMAVLYSLIDVNKRLNKIVHDTAFTNRLTLYASTTDGFIVPLPDYILDRFCSHILPKIYHKVKCLNLEPISIKCILLATNYPNLTGLALYNVQDGIVLDLLTGKIFYFDSSNHRYIKGISQLELFE
ncbi:unnamed protein product [Rotaria sordida]|uniref:F-box domain-containing protein n=1 Tax=Rotaria sordida TaxID=392033 RepID=A0A813YUE7_9BILA|nr:unnamed protein product [Rotaria sordida]CAF0889873.1 unnamed protein product [Rotaria sordida]